MIWNVEGDYVKTLEALDAAGKTAIQPCRYTTTGRPSWKTGTLKPSRGAKTAWDPRS